jgi:hypothetical protein
MVELTFTGVSKTIKRCYVDLCYHSQLMTSQSENPGMTDKLEYQLTIIPGPEVYHLMLLDLCVQL